MNKTYLKIILIKAALILQMLPLDLGAQNLVYNGDFELYNACPTWGVSSNSQIIHAIGWFVCGGSPDYWNVCSNGVPNAQVGYQQDCCGGTGYAGEYMICSEHAPGDDICREYMGTKLLDTLKAGHKYLASMYVSKANFNYSIATIGMLFTDTAVILPNPQTDPILVANPQVKGVYPITDTVNWVLIQDTLIALGNEAYLTIGNFNTTNTSDTISSSGNWWFYGSAYYFIDGVSLYDMAAIGVKDIENKKTEISVYPNPNNGSFTMSYTGLGKQLQVAIYNLIGQQVLTQQYTVNDKITISGLSEGIYFVKISVDDKLFNTQKIIVGK